MPSRRAAMIAPTATSSHTPTIAVGRVRRSPSSSTAARVAAGHGHLGLDVTSGCLEARVAHAAR